MPIPTLNDWQKTTSHIGKRSPEMGIIDDKIRAYWNALGDRGEMNKAAYAIRKACRHWKQNHPESKRMRKVDQLEREAEAELSQHQPGWNEFVQSKQAGRAGNLKSLAPGYHHERRMYVVDGKQTNPVAAGAIRDFALGDGLNLHEMDDGQWDGYAYNPAIANMNGNRVLYFDKQKRLEHMLLVQHGRLVWARNNQNFNTPNHPFMFAMDGYGNVFARSDQLQGQEFFNHSSFNGGREVICAGMIGATNGELDFISNESGHYQPSRGALYSCLQKLIGAHVTMVFGNTRTRVRAMGAGDWPAIHYGNTPGFDQVHAATIGNPPAPTPNPPTYTRWVVAVWVQGVKPVGQG
jgi:hypothetical protein